MSAPRLLAPTTISGGIPTAGAGTANTIALWTPDNFTLGNSLLTQAGSVITNATGAIRANGTTQSTPAFMRYDATTSGIYFPAANEIGFTISSQNAMFISSGRNVGIGTTSPIKKGTIKGGDLGIDYGQALCFTNGGTAVYTADAAVRVTFSSPNDVLQLQASGASDGIITFHTGATAALRPERARIDSAGNLGLGTTPNAWNSAIRAFDLRTNSLWNFNSGSDSVAYWTVNAYTDAAGNVVYKNSAAASQYTQISGAHVWYRAASGAAGAACSLIESARIDSSGNVGIGTASPGAKLEIPFSGTAAGCRIQFAGGPFNYFNATNHYFRTLGDADVMTIASDKVGIGTTTPASALHVRNNTAGITLDSTLGGGRQYQLNPLRTGLSNSGFEIRDVTAGTGVLWFDATQQVGIGTPTPASRLDVAGTITCDDAGTGLKLPSTPGNADTQTLDCYAETTLNSGFTTSGITSTGTFTVTARATRIGRAIALTIRIAPSGGASLTFASGWNITLTGMPQMPIESALAATSSDATVGRNSVQVSQDATPILYGGTTGAYALGANVSLNVSGIIT